MVISRAEPADKTYYWHFDQLDGDGSKDVWYRKSGTTMTRLSQPPTDQRIINAHNPAHEHENNKKRPTSEGVVVPDLQQQHSFWRCRNHDLTVSTTGTCEGSEAGCYQRYRLMTTRRAAAVLHQILNADMRLRALDEAETKQIQESRFLSHWADVTVKTYDGKSLGMYKTLRVTSDKDDKVLAAFVKHNRNSSWMPIAFDDCPNLDNVTMVDRAKYLLWMGCDKPSRNTHQEELDHAPRNRPNEESTESEASRVQGTSTTIPAGGSHPPLDWQLWLGAMWLQNLDTKTFYQIMDHEYIPREETLHLEDTVQEALYDSGGTWKVAHILYQQRGVRKISLWACVNANNVIVDVSVTIQENSF
jgi:hypothetical protein